MADNINISPDMINNLVNMLKSNSNTNSNTNTNTSTSTTSNSSETSNSDPTLGANRIFFDSKNESNVFDIDTIMKIKSIMQTLNKKDDPKSNLLYSLKPYLRKSKQDKLDQYVNLLKISEVANMFKEGDSK